MCSFDAKLAGMFSPLCLVFIVLQGKTHQLGGIAVMTMSLEYPARPTQRPHLGSARSTMSRCTAGYLITPLSRAEIEKKLLSLKARSGRDE